MHRPKRSLGQNFLRDNNVVHRIVAALDLTADDRVIEIGPGRGALTESLVSSGADVVALEFDRDLVPALRRKFAAADNFKVIEADALDADFASLVPQSTSKLVANLPYNISTPILQRLIEQRGSFSVLVLMFQREVVDRITATPGGKERGFLSVLTEMSFKIERLFDVPPTAFFPVPKVWSSVVRLVPLPHDENENDIRLLISAAFLQKRKTLLNNLRHIPDAIYVLEAAAIDPMRRAETLSLDEWRRLAEAVKRGKSGRPSL